MTKKNKPLYTAIVDDLKAKITAGIYKPDGQLPTEAELSSRHGVSRITTRRALEELEREGYIYRVRGSGSFVKPLSRVQQENRAELPGKMVSMIMPSDDDIGTIGYVRGASDWLNAHGYYLSVHQSHYDSDKERDLVESLTRKGISAIILYPRHDHANYELLYRLSLSHYPIVTIDKYLESIPVGSIVSDNFNGAYQAAARLIAWGHRKIAFLSGVSIESTSSVRDRYFGYCQALKDHGIPIDSSIVRLNVKPYREEIGADRFYQELLRFYRSEHITAVQVENDLMAANLLNQCADAGIRVPQELSIIGFDNNPLTQHLVIPLTTVEQQFYEIGRTAAEVIVQWLEHGTPATERIYVPVHLIERGTASWADSAVEPAPPRT